MGTNNQMIPVPLIDLKSPEEPAAYATGTSDRRYWAKWASFLADITTHKAEIGCSKV
jgi:hypothetical protein